MDKKMILEELLCNEKNLCDIYLHATIESSNEDIYENFLKNLTTTLEQQHCVYKLMEELGYYKIENINKTSYKSKIDQLLSK